MRSGSEDDGGGSSVLEFIALDTHEHDRIYDLELRVIMMISLWSISGSTYIDG